MGQALLRGQLAVSPLANSLSPRSGPTSVKAAVSAASRGSGEPGSRVRQVVEHGDLNRAHCLVRWLTGEDGESEMCVILCAYSLPGRSVAAMFER